MGIIGRVERFASRLREKRRRVYVGPERVWVELRGEPGDQIDAIIERVERSHTVRWARWNSALERLVIAHDADPEGALAAVRAAEAALGLDKQPFRSDPPPNPSDGAARAQTIVRAAADVASIGLGAALSAAGAKPRAMEIDLAALSAAFENLPPARRWLDRVLGGSRSDLALGVTSALTSALTQGSTGQIVDLAYRGLRYAEVKATREAWARREAELASDPESHPKERPKKEPRPRPLPKGPIERYSEPAGMVSLGGFGFGVATTGRAEKAAGSIFGTVPRPARVGREAFGAMLGRMLAEKGYLVLDDRTLRRLDRLDRVVLPDEILGARLGEIAVGWPSEPGRTEELMRMAHHLFRPEAPDLAQREGDSALAPCAAPPAEASQWRSERSGRAVSALMIGDVVFGYVGIERIVTSEVRAMVAHLRAAGLTIAAVSSDPERVAWCAPERLVDRASLRAEVRAMQQHGHAVWLVTLGPEQAAFAADLTLALPRAGGPAPFGAHILAPPREGAESDPKDVIFFADAIEAARRASRQSVGIAGAEAAAGLVLSLRGQRMSVLRRIMNVSGIATLAAVANGARVAYSVVERPLVSGQRTPWHALEPADVLRRLSAREQGLTAEEVAARRVASPEPPRPIEEFGRAVWREIASPFAPVLATGAGLSALAGSPLDAGLVTGTVLASGLVSGWQQVQASHAMRELERARPSPVRVRRAGVCVDVEPQEVVVGDILELVAGDRIPADCRLLRAVRLETDESSLTGESIPIRKDVAASFAGVLAERASMLYADTTVAAGEALAVVVAVGADTEARRGLLHARRAESTGVHARLTQLTEITGPIATAAALTIVGVGLMRNRPVQELVDGAVSLAVAAVPETLPLLATAAQLAAARRLSARKALVRNVAAVEALGRVDVLCADKTGTLTEGILALVQVASVQRALPLSALADPEEPLREVLRAALLASPEGASGGLPHPTDRALVEGGRRAGVDAVGFVRLSELPFEPGRGYHATAAEREGKRQLFIKGAPEVIAPLCGGLSEQILARAVSLAEEGYRVLAVASRDKQRETLEADEIRDLDFLGFVCIADPVRPSAREAIAALRRAGIDVMMITGDHPATARAIARELGISEDPLVITGPELERMSEEELAQRLPHIRVFARATPQLKVRIVSALQRAGRVVAMTGDGANDAPAIRLADVGVALGERATAAARGAADLLVTDERIETLVDAVLEGRAMWASVRDAVSTLVGGNIGELLFTLFGALLDGRAPLGARQLMLVNLLTDALPALTIAVRPPAHTTPERLMGEGPDRSLGAALRQDLAVRAAATGLATFGAWAIARPLSTPESAGTVALLTLVGTQLGQTLWLGWRNPPVVAASLGSAAALFVIVQTPGLSQIAGSRPQGVASLANVALFTAAGVLGAGLTPKIYRWVDGAVSLDERIAQLLDSESGRYVRESRFLVRLSDVLAMGPEPEEILDEGSGGSPM